MIIGYVLMKTGFFTREFVDTSNKLIFYIFLPVLLFYKISISDFSQVFILPNILIMYGSIFLVFFISYGLAKIIKLSTSQTGTFIMNTFRGNLAYIGLPICFYAFGEYGLTAASILIAFAAPLVNILGVISLIIFNKNSIKPTLIIKETVLNPLVIACLLGIGVSVTGITLPLFIERTLSIISGITLPLALFAIGGTIEFRQFQGSFLAIGANVLMKLVASPLIAYLFLKISRESLTVPDKVLVIMLGCPTAVAAYLFAASLNGDKDLASSTIIATTVLSIFSFGIWLHLLGAI